MCLFHSRQLYSNQHLWSRCVNPQNAEDATPRFFAAVKLADMDIRAGTAAVESRFQNRFDDAAAAAREGQHSVRKMNRSLSSQMSLDRAPNALAHVVGRNRHGHIMCSHGCRMFYCLQCGGPGICKHGKRNHNCKVCSINRLYTRTHFGGKKASSGVRKIECSISTSVRTRQYLGCKE